jgi:hypothetical protein
LRFRAPFSKQFTLLVFIGSEYNGYAEEVEFTKFSYQNELMIFWEACKTDNRSYGMQYVKNRRIGASFMAIIELLESGTINDNCSVFF